MAAHFSSLPISFRCTAPAATGCQCVWSRSSGTTRRVRALQTARSVPTQSLRVFAQSSHGRSGHSSVGSSELNTHQSLKPESAENEKRAAATALVAVLRVTQAFKVASALAIHFIFDIKHVFWRKAEETQQTLTQAQQTLQQAVEQPAQRMSQAETELKAAFARLQQHAVAGGEALMKMLHSLDKPSITLDTKWADMQEQLAGNKDVSDRLQQLYASSTESAQTVAAMLAENGGSLHRSYWTSSQTKKVIDQEEELRSVVFAQMLGASS